MPDIELNFPLAEYADRLAATRRAMEAAEIELLIVSDPSNMAWLTGYDGWSFYVHQCVLVPPDGEPIWFGRGQDANGAPPHGLYRGGQYRRLSRSLCAVDRAPSDGLSGQHPD